MVINKVVQKAPQNISFHPIAALFMALYLISTPVGLRAETVNLWPLSETSPSHVYAVWKNINRLLITIADENLNDKEIIDEIKSQQLTRFEDKRPRDVLGKVNDFRRTLDKLRKDLRLAPTSLSRDLSGKDMQPKTVFLNSLLALDSLQEWERLSFIGPLDAKEFFALKIEDGKIPSDVFAQVDLATRRLILIAKTQE